MSPSLICHVRIPGRRAHSHVHLVVHRPSPSVSSDIPIYPQMSIGILKVYTVFGLDRLNKTKGICLPSTLKQSPMHGPRSSVKGGRINHRYATLTSGNHRQFRESLLVHLSKKSKRISRLVKERLDMARFSRTWEGLA